MSFYLSPPNGVVPYHKLEEYGLKRLKFFLRLVECRNESEVEDVLQDASIVDQSDCLITDTTKDSVSHHILRLLLGGCAETSSFFCESEKALFKLRVEKLVREEWIDLFQCLEKSLARQNVSDNHNNPMTALSFIVESLKGRFLSWSNLAEELLCEKSKVSFCLPYHMVLQLVAGRHVNINKGLAAVPVKQLRAVLVEQFERLMWEATGLAREARVSAIRDERIKRLAAVLKRVYRSEVTVAAHLPTKNHTPLRLAELWSSSVMFPPCMRRLTNILRRHHRLKHHDRVQLTLFLKELGLPVHDALLLWKHQYSEPAAPGPSEACGRWQGNERRYIYNIRHLYGLEGGRVNYKAHSCAFLQENSISSHGAGGCPFVLSDETALTSLLTDLGVSSGDVPELPGFIEGKEYSRACHSFMCCQLKRTKEKFNSSCHADEDQHLKEQFLAKKCLDQSSSDKRLSDQCSSDKHLSDQWSSDKFPSPDTGIGDTSRWQISSCTESNVMCHIENYGVNNNNRRLVNSESLPDHQNGLKVDNALARLTHSVPAGLTKPQFNFSHGMECSTAHLTARPVSHATESTIRQTGQHPSAAKKLHIRNNSADCQKHVDGSNHHCQKYVDCSNHHCQARQPDGASLGSVDVSAVLLDNSCVEDAPPCKISRNTGLLPCDDPVKVKSHSPDTHEDILAESNQRCTQRVVSRKYDDSVLIHVTSPSNGDAVVLEGEVSQPVMAEKFHKFRHKKPSEYFWHCKSFL